MHRCEECYDRCKVCGETLSFDTDLCQNCYEVAQREFSDRCAECDGITIDGVCLKCLQAKVSRLSSLVREGLEEKR